MGGKAFATLSTPRMPPETYDRVLTHVLTLLRKHFRHAESPIEAPGKNDHGDVDVLVAEPLDVKYYNVQTTAAILDAHKWMQNGPSFHFAISWPESADSTASPSNTLFSDESTLPVLEPPAASEQVSPVTTKTTESALLEEASASTDVPQRFVQLDVHICPNVQQLNLLLFLQAHGDLWNMLGGIVRRFGLTCTHDGLFIRIEEIEPHNKSLARVKLTDDPSTILNYLGLNEQKYWSRFKDWNDMMKYAAGCRFHDPGWGRYRDAERNTDQDGNGSKKDDGLKANDRQRVHKRAAFACWVEEYLPAHQDDLVGDSAHLSREQVIEDAKNYFGSDIATSFDQQKAKGTRLFLVDKLWADIRKALPIEGTEVGGVMKGLKREIVGDARDEIPDELYDVQMAYAESRFDAVHGWALKNWKQVGQRQEAYDREKCRLHLLAKIEKDYEKRMEEEKGERKEGRTEERKPENGFIK